MSLPKIIGIVLLMVIVLGVLIESIFVYLVSSVGTLITLFVLFGASALGAIAIALFSSSG